MKLTNGETARVFAMYWNCPIVPLSEACTIAKKEGGYTGWGIRFENGVHKISFGTNLFAIEKYGLFITPLDKITDEHAFEVAELISGHVDAINQYQLTENNSKFIEVLCLNKQGEEYGGFVRIYYDGTVTWDYHNKDKYDGNELRLWGVFQYLISKGYAVPLWFGIEHWANGMTAIELEIAFDKTLTKAA